jgi:hypothetical protein
MKSSNPKKRKFIKTCSFGSLIGTTIEFFDFYIYANAAVLVLFSFGGQYQFGFLSLATFSIAFLLGLVQQYLAIMVIRSAKLRW